MKSQLGGLRRKFLGNHLNGDSNDPYYVYFNYPIVEKTRESQNSYIIKAVGFPTIAWNDTSSTMCQLYNDTDEIVEIESKELTFTSKNKPNA